MWNYSALMFKFGIVDGRAVFALLFFFYDMSFKSLMITVIFFLLLAGLEYTGYDIPNALRRSTILLTGSHKLSKPPNIR